METPPRKLKRNVNSNDLQDNFVKYLYLKIPFMNDELLNALLNNNNEKIFEIISNINNNDMNINNHLLNKSHDDIVNGLKESIIHIILNYHENNNNYIYTIPKLNKVNKKNHKIIERMNYLSDYETLQDMILKIYNNPDIVQKNKMLLTILMIIAKKLAVLQEKCGFIHGDLHSKNIMIKYEHDFDIKFIDFGRSAIQWPLLNDNIVILHCDISKNINSMKRINNNLDMIKNPHLKAIDLFHLFNDLYLYETDNFKNIPELKYLINDIRTKYMIGNVRKKNHHQMINLTRTTNFLWLNNFNYEFLYPENFEKYAYKLLS